MGQMSDEEDIATSTISHPEKRMYIADVGNVHSRCWYIQVRSSLRNALTKPEWYGLQLPRCPGRGPRGGLRRSSKGRRQADVHDFRRGKQLNASKDGNKLTLLGGFQFSLQNNLCIPLGARRLLALLALEDGEVDRTTATERLWPDSRHGRAAANFRSALWQGKRAGCATLIDCVGPRLRLSSSVQVDLHELLRNARQIVEAGPSTSGDPRYLEIIDGLSHELLPTWSDDWLLPKRVRWDQVRLHYLETLAQQFLTVENYLTALEAALAAIAIEPFRESAHRLVLKVHIAEGNSACAMKHYHRYRGLLVREVGVKPSRQMVELIHPLTSA